jgi:hypothetical protein
MNLPINCPVCKQQRTLDAAVEMHIAMPPATPEGAPITWQMNIGGWSVCEKCKQQGQAQVEERTRLELTQMREIAELERLYKL